MIRYIYGDELHRFPFLRDSMFSDRAIQFDERLGWDVQVDDLGHEMDEYDGMNPLYVIWERSDGSHGGSMRFLPTTGNTMINDHFSDLTDGVKIKHPLIWECTRFCLSRETEIRVSAALMLAGMELGIGFELEHIVGVFDRKMCRFYRRMGWSPTTVGTSSNEVRGICVGLWAIDHEVRIRLLERAGLDDELSAHWFERAFGRSGAVAA